MAQAVIACGVTVAKDGMAWQCTVRYVSDLTVYMFRCAMLTCRPSTCVGTGQASREREREDRQIDREKEEEGGNNRPERFKYQSSCFSVKQRSSLLITLFHVVFLFQRYIIYWYFASSHSLCRYQYSRTIKITTMLHSEKNTNKQNAPIPTEQLNVGVNIDQK